MRKFIMITLVLLAGCMPTQDQLRMERDLAEMKRRLAQLEIRNNDVSQAKIADGDSLQRQLAELTAGLDTMRVDFQSVNGRMDDIRQDNAATRDELQMIKDDMGLQVTSLENRVAALEQGQPKPAGTLPPTSQQQQTGAPAAAPLQLQGSTGPSQSGQQTPEQLYEDAIQLIRTENRFQDGRKLLEKFTANYPKHDLYVNALYWIGEAFYGEKEYEMAILQFQDVISKYPKHPKAPAAMLKQAMAFNALKDVANARTTMQKLIETYPNSDVVMAAKSFLEKGQ